MANEAISVTDPFGNTVFLSEGICIDEPNRQEQEIYDDAITVIRKPALMIKVENGNSTEQYYFRSVGWHSTMLIVAEFKNEKWKTFKCIKNPSNEELSEILKKGKQML